MRIFIIIFCSLACLGLVAVPAVGQKSYSRRGYGSCFCDFGYPGYSCVPVVSCSDEGGRCRKPCRRQHD
jgi:hypothetical protein